MLRKTREFVAGGIYHVFNRGNNRTCFSKSAKISSVSWDYCIRADKSRDRNLPLLPHEQSLSSAGALALH